MNEFVYFYAAHKIGHCWTFSDWSKNLWLGRIRSRLTKKTLKICYKNSCSYENSDQKMLKSSSKLYEMDFYVSLTLCFISHSVSCLLFFSWEFVELFVSQVTFFFFFLLVIVFSPLLFDLNLANYLFSNVILLVSMKWKKDEKINDCGTDNGYYCWWRLTFAKHAKTLRKLYRF